MREDWDYWLSYHAGAVPLDGEAPGEQRVVDGDGEEDGVPPYSVEGWGDSLTQFWVTLHALEARSWLPHLLRVCVSLSL